ncbi:MAG: glycosyltransferase [Peptococcaceae bacterium]|nr:glycosyltransferase [Peptococcaceae bacterium]
MGRLKILHIIGGGEFGGAERHILNLVQGVDPAEVEMGILCLFARPFAEVAREAGVPAQALPMRNKLDFHVMGKMKNAVAAFDPDIVHTHGVRANLLGRVAAALAGRPVVTTVHSLLAMDYPDPASRLANSLAERCTRGMTCHFIAVSNELREALIHQGIPGGRVTAVHNGVDLARFTPDAATGRALPGYPGDVPLVSIIARLHAVKGHRFFLHAAKAVLAKKPGVRFLVVGGGPDENALTRMVSDLGIAGAVDFLGFVDDIPTLLARLNVLVVASRWEGFGLTAAEALALAVPVVATDVGGLPEIIRPFETGLLVPYGNSQAMADAVIWILEHPAEAREMATRGRAVVRREFTARQMAVRTVEVYRKVAAKWPRC